MEGLSGGNGDTPWAPVPTRPAEAGRSGGTTAARPEGAMAPDGSSMGGGSQVGRALGVAGTGGGGTSKPGEGVRGGCGVGGGGSHAGEPVSAGGAGPRHDEENEPCWWGKKGPEAAGGGEGGEGSIVPGGTAGGNTKQGIAGVNQVVRGKATGRETGAAGATGAGGGPSRDLPEHSGERR